MLFRKQKKEEKTVEPMINIFDDLSDLSQAERKQFFYWNGLFNNEPNLIRSGFNLDHYRKTLQARQSN